MTGAAPDVAPRSSVVAATQLGAEHPQTQARRVVADWTAFLDAGPSPIRDLELVTRTPRRLFDTLRGHTQLESLGPLAGLVRS